MLVGHCHRLGFCSDQAAMHRFPAAPENRAVNAFPYPSWRTPKYAKPFRTVEAQGMTGGPARRNGIRIGPISKRSRCRQGALIQPRNVGVFDNHW
uniref:Uncharacterized protein n=1 Tax=Dechloromonas aromatica (strain RCB) TaxID=159087 RepID=Q47D60_DECAR